MTALRNRVSGPRPRRIRAFSPRTRAFAQVKEADACVLARECAIQVSVARYYDPTTAQFLTRDPLEATTGQAYQYVGGDPLDASDPGGLDCGWTSPWDCGPSLQQASDWAAGFGDTVTFGGTKQIRRLINYEVNGQMDDMVDHCDDFYHWGNVGGDIANFFDVPARHLSFPRAARHAQGPGNRLQQELPSRVARRIEAQEPRGVLAHYHRRGAPDMFGNTPEGQGIGRHRPWQTSDADSSFWDRF